VSHQGLKDSTVRSISQVRLTDEISCQGGAIPQMSALTDGKITT